MDKTRLARAIVQTILNDLTGRSGFDGAWDQCDSGIQDEIQETLTEKVLAHLNEGE